MIKLHDKLAEIRAAREEGEKGFTLIELLVVVIIIGILAAIAIPVFLGQQEQARDSAAKSAITNAKTLIVSYLVEDGTFPATAQDIADDAAGDDELTMVVNGNENGFCVQSKHDGSDKTWASDDDSGVIEGTCVGGVATPA